MARRYREQELEKQYGDLHEVIPETVNKHGQAWTANALGVSQNFISNWLRKNGYTRETVYILTDKAKKALAEMKEAQK